MRLLMISNQISDNGHAGFRDAYSAMVEARELEAFKYLTPAATARQAGHSTARAEMLRAAGCFRPDVVLICAPRAFAHDADWIESFLLRNGKPRVLCWEGDAFHRWAKPLDASTRAWFAASDLVFSAAREPHFSLFRAAGARDVRLLPQTYCQVIFEKAALVSPPIEPELEHDVIVIGSRLARWGVVSRTPGARGRASLVRQLQRRRTTRLALYGRGWSGRGARGPLPFADQPRAIRKGLVSANWDHFHRHESFASNRLPISMLAGRVHVTTAHPRMDWIPNGTPGVYFEESPAAVVHRVEELLASPAVEILEAGAAAHKWVRDRLSNREAARFLLAPVDGRFLAGLPQVPWLDLASEWKR